jgi:predicted RNase H-related nuclease YkuK (DUF458 family)
LLASRYGGIEANCGGTEVGGISGDDARVVLDQNEDTGDDKEVVKAVSMFIDGGGVSCQVKSAAVAARMLSSIPSIPCMGAFT